MTPSDNPHSEQRIMSYLDGQMNASEQAAFEDELKDHPELAAQLELHRRIERSLGKSFPLKGPTDRQMASLRDKYENRDPAVEPRRSQVGPLGIQPHYAALLGVAAVFCFVFGAWYFLSHGPRKPYFEPRPLAELYHDTIEMGFKPYYECHDPDRFAATFQERQGKPLRLEELPEGSRMLGLSYPGGLSRDTTAMLCLVDERPVMVFVDREECDQDGASKNPSADVHVLRRRRMGLVFYEVTPFSEPRVLDHLVAADRPPAGR